MRNKELVEISILPNNHPNVCLAWTFLVCFSPPAIIKMNTTLVDRVANTEGRRIPQDIALETLLQSANNPENAYLCIFFIAWNAVGCFTFCQTKETQKWNSRYSIYSSKIQLKRLDTPPTSGSKESQVKQLQNNGAAWSPCCSNSNPKTRQHRCNEQPG